MTLLPDAVVEVAATAFRNGDVVRQNRTVPEETAVALSYDRVGYAVMMTTPCDLTDFAIGFSLSEGIIDDASDILGCDVITVDQGIECRMEVAHDVATRLVQRRRHLTGALGCGLCGLESLAEATRAIPRVTTTLSVTADAILRATRGLPLQQALNRRTHGIHAAAFLDPADGSLLVREDVGRHNALDKLIGAIARQNRKAASGILLMTSRLSIELIQKAAIAGIPIIVAVSVPTAHAIRAAGSAGITLAAIARDDGFEIFTHATRIVFGAQTHVA